MAWRNPFKKRAPDRPHLQPLTAAVVSATSRYDGDAARKQDRRVSEAWDLYRLVGEIHYQVTQQSRLVGRVGWTMTVNGNELDGDQSNEILTAAFGSKAILRDLQTTAATHYQVAGGYHLAKTGDQWEILNNPAEGPTKKKLEAADIVVTVENPDPYEPKARLDSPVLAALDIGRELILARGQARAMARSRTAQLNTLFYPSEGAGADPATFEKELMDVMVAPLADEMSTASVVPNLVGFPGDLIDKIKSIDMSGELDEKLHERIDRLIHQLAMVLDSPIEILEGSGDANHWGAWLISEDNYLNHIEPTASPIGEGFAQALEILLGNPDAEPGTGTDVEITPDPANLLKRRPTIDHALKAAELGIAGEEWVLEQLGAAPEDAGPGLMAILEARRARAAGGDSAGPQAVQEPAATAAVVTPKAIAAAAEDAPSVDPEELARLDVDLGIQMSDLVADAADRSLERLGARLRSVAQGGKIELPDVPNQEVAIAYRETIQNQDAIVDDTAARFEPQFDRFTARAFEKVRAAGVDIQPAADATADAFAAFRAEVAKVVSARRGGGTGDSEAWAASLRVNALLGGNADPSRTPVTSATGFGSPVPGIALGARSLSAIARQYGVRPGRWLWHHAYTGPSPHLKHQSFEGREIPPGGTVLEDGINFFPGDHHGCRCLRVPELVRINP